MHTVIRSYAGAGAKELFDILEQRKSEVQSAMKEVAGLVSYTLLRSADGGGISVTTCADKAGTDESARVASDWVRKNAANTGVGAPRVAEGTVIIHTL